MSDLRAVEKRPEVVIIGAGLTGLSTAYHLAKLGVRSVVLEAGVIADGASGRTGGLVLEGTAVGLMEQVDACVEGLRRLVEAEQIDCSLHLPGCWEIEHRKDEAGTMLPWTDAGARIAIAKLISGGTVEPARLSLGLARAAVAAGAVICRADAGDEDHAVARAGSGNRSGAASFAMGGGGVQRVDRRAVR